MGQEQSNQRDAKGQFVKGHTGSKATQFKKGMKPWNKGKRGYMGANRTSFKAGQIPHTANPLGTVKRRVRKRDGRVFVEYDINIDWHGQRKPHNNYKWYLWEKAHQRDRPQGYVLAVKNGNQDDIRLENLELISRKELAIRNRN